MLQQERPAIDSTAQPEGALIAEEVQTPATSWRREAIDFLRHQPLGALGG